MQYQLLDSSQVNEHVNLALGKSIKSRVDIVKTYMMITCMIDVWLP